MSIVFYLPQHRTLSTRHPLALRRMWSTGCWVSADESQFWKFLGSPRGVWNKAFSKAGWCPTTRPLSCLMMMIMTRSTLSFVFYSAVWQAGTAITRLHTSLQEERNALGGKRTFRVQPEWLCLEDEWSSPNLGLQEPTKESSWNHSILSHSNQHQLQSHSLSSQGTVLSVSLTESLLFK